MKSRAGPNCALSVTGGDGLRITRPHQRTRYIYGQPRPSRTRSALPSAFTQTEDQDKPKRSIAEAPGLPEIECRIPLIPVRKRFTELQEPK